MRSRAGWPTASATTSSGATGASSSRRDRSTISISRASSATRSPGWTKRCATVPAIGATRRVSRRALRASSTAASAACQLDCAAASFEIAVSSPVGEMKPCATSARLLSSARRAMSAWARAEAAVCSAWRRRQSTSVVSSSPITWPARTVSPSRTDRRRSSAATLALSNALFAAFSPPETSTVRARPIGRSSSRSAGASSSAAASRAPVGAASGRGALPRHTNPATASRATAASPRPAFSAGFTRGGPRPRHEAAGRAGPARCAAG